MHPQTVEQAKKASSSANTSLKKTAIGARDSVEISSSVLGNRALESVKAKIRNRYYNSDAVLDDLSDKFAKLFSA